MYADYYQDPVTGMIQGIEPQDFPKHNGHCLDMLRQGIMCAADVRWAPLNIVCFEGELLTTLHLALLSGSGAKTSRSLSSDLTFLTRAETGTVSRSGQRITK